MMGSNKRFMILLILSMMLSIESVSSQVNTESMRNQDHELGSHFTVGANFSFIKGNSSIFQSRVNSRWDYVLEESRFFVIVNHKISSKDDQIFINQGFGHLRGVKDLNATLQAELYLQQEYNEFINLESRKLVGVGFRFKARDIAQNSGGSTKMAIVVGLGMMFEQEKMDAGPLGVLGDPVHGEEARLLRSSNYIVLNWSPTDLITLGSTSYYQVDIKRFEDFRLLSQSQAKLGLTAHLSLDLNLNLRYDSEPPANIKDLDLEFSHGFTYTFK